MTFTPENHDPEELAALYWSGAVSAEERAAVEACLEGDDAGDAAAAERLRHALARFAPANEALLDSVEPVAPPPELRARVVAAAADSPASAPESGATIWSSWGNDGDAADVLLRGDVSEWLDTGVDGVQVRRLFVDRENDRMTAVFKMAPGASYPGHRHHGPEECLVLEGAFTVDGHSMRAGDFLRRPAGSRHGETRTEEGCLLLITSSLHDELLAG